MERMPIWQIALRRLEMPVPRFLALYVAPVVVATFFIAIIIVFLTGGLAEGALFAGFTGFLLFSCSRPCQPLRPSPFPCLKSSVQPR